MLELLVLGQFLGALPSRMRTWVQSQAPRTRGEAASLVEDLTQMSQQEGIRAGAPPAGLVATATSESPHQGAGRGALHPRLTGPGPLASEA
ncbi:hypothetical protein HPG69_007219 [Diceros bicornis minor]|uniref:SCAN box domain-containing protein n=1 Tax=Diceros bicornis minor TaxID=77932 RepID=A0A7J7FN54_DICBM|nr:hypothetical protein HPG69_007219 [Diceros bicornis minor]